MSIKPVRALLAEPLLNCQKLFNDFLQNIEPKEFSIKNEIEAINDEELQNSIVNLGASINREDNK